MVRFTATPARRLRVDVIDVYQVHWPDLETPLAETAATLDDLRRTGKIRMIGVSNCSPVQMDAFRAVTRLDAVQPPYNLLERTIEADILPYAKNASLTVLSYGAPYRGLLTRNITAETKFEGDDLRKSDPKFQGPWLKQYLGVVQELDALARDRFGKSVLALRWILDQGPIIMRDIDAILKRYVPEPIPPTFMAPPVTRPVE
jgi:aryl-alcohol dehydrogenase-like predicted oxidoreductase